ncbi:MAG: M20 family metallopeptidase [Alkaliphilus sp.]
MKEKQLLEKLTSCVSEEELVSLTRKLISIPSHCDVPTKEEEIVRELGKFFKEQGVSYRLQEVDSKRSNIIAQLSGAGGGRSLALNGHLDTVPPYRMNFEPFAAKFIDNKIFGRGAVDMKGPIASMIMVMLAFERAGIKLKGDLLFAGVLAEETNSDGCETLIKSGFKVDGAVVGEASNREYAIAHRGLEWLEIEITGKIVHGGVPELGISAIVNAAKFILRVQEKIVPRIKKYTHPHMGTSVMNFGRIDGGTQPSTVAGKCIIQLDRRYTPEENLDEVLGEFENILEKLSYDDPNFKGVMRRMPSNLMKTYNHVPLETSPDDPLVHIVKDSIKGVTGISPKLNTRRGWTDAAIFSYYGKMPAVVYGPGCISRSHGPNEYIAVEELLEGFRVYCMIAMKYCGLN